MVGSSSNFPGAILPRKQNIKDHKMCALLVYFVRETITIAQILYYCKLMYRMAALMLGICNILRIKQNAYGIMAFRRNSGSMKLF